MPNLIGTVSSSCRVAVDVACYAAVRRISGPPLYLPRLQLHGVIPRLPYYRRRAGTEQKSRSNGTKVRLRMRPWSHVLRLLSHCWRRLPSLRSLPDLYLCLAKIIRPHSRASRASTACIEPAYTVRLMRASRVCLRCCCSTPRLRQRVRPVDPTCLLARDRGSPRYCFRRLPVREPITYRRTRW
jgi:hypothetical protein